MLRDALSRLSEHDTELGRACRRAMCLKASREQRRAEAAKDPEIDGWVHVTPSPSEKPDDTPEWLLQAERLLAQVCRGSASALFPSGRAPTAVPSIHRDLPGRSRTATLLRLAIVFLVAARLLQLAVLCAVLEPVRPRLAPVHPSISRRHALRRPRGGGAAMSVATARVPAGATAEEPATAATWAAAGTELPGAWWPSLLALPAPPPPSAVPRSLNAYILQFVPWPQLVPASPGHARYSR